MTENEETAGQPGRPPFEPTEEQRDSVEQGAYVGMTDLAMAAALGISPPTLRKHFAQELLNGHSKKRLETINALFKQMRDGNVSATKHLERMGSMVPSQGDQPAQGARKTEDLGKKAEAQIAAREPPPKGSRWSGLIN